MKNTFELSQVIQSLRKELSTVARKGEGEKIRFTVTNIDVEFQTVVEEETAGEAGGKLKFLVLDASSKVSGKHKDAVTHKIKLSLEVIDTTKNNADGKNVPTRLQLHDKA